MSIFLTIDIVFFVTNRMIKIEWLAAFLGVNMSQFTSVPFELIMPMTSVKNHNIFSSNEGNDIIQKYPGVAAKINRYVSRKKFKLYVF